MSFIGIITNPKNEEYVKEKLYEKFSAEQIIFITDKNIANIKNIRFETIVIDVAIKDIKNLKTLVSNAKYIILNSDLVTNLEILENLNLIVISYGFNNKATFTVSSVSESEIIICLQRMIENIFGVKFEPQELEIKMHEKAEIYAIICIKILLILYHKVRF